MFSDKLKPIYQKPAKITLCVISEFDIFGEEDLISGASARSYTVISQSSNGKLLKVSKQDFETLVMVDEPTKEKIMLRFKQKMDMINKRIEQVYGSVASNQRFFYNSQVDIKLQKIKIFDKFQDVALMNSKSDQ